MEYTPIFPMSVWHGNFENNDELKEVLLPFIDETKDTLEMPEDWVTDKVVTSFGNMKVNELLLVNERQKIQDAYWNKLNKMFENEWNADMIDAWYNYYTEGEWQEKHSHSSIPFAPRCDFSAIHFVSWKEDTHLPVIFHDPLAILKNGFANHTNFAEYHPRIKEGDFIVFPSYLEHSVPKQPSTPDYPRITISFNLKLNSFI